ncbi:esterase-like activity of phytase family protein [Devosia neptuniae]|uniref:Esterase-like activity of phytase family protein n=1 Tax=Devosia neptuniae TaxID=191302 RepID=A0ABY6C954_9HYPH|nr:esterase-like activity of phytase family protein [Devosia neptuniae]UXN68764.1 esterase-like activity of phytase family protein [Devosia neptuniae]
MYSTKFLAALTAALLATVVSVHAEQVFNRIASFPVALNAPDAEATSAEIITASDDGLTLIYSDSPAGGIGFVDLTDAKAPKNLGFLSLDGEPTSVTIIGGKAYVGVNTSESFVAPSGKLVVVDIASKAVDAEYDLGGQPDSVAHNAAGTLIAIAIENERDEEVNDGDLPQLPAGFVVIFEVAAKTLKTVDMTGIADVGGEDPEPEFVDFNANDEIAVTLQENNWIAIIDGKTGTVTGGFSAGTVSVENVDTKKDGALNFTGKTSDVPREPDAIKWLDADRLVVANEGDWNGGSRSFSIFNRDGSVVYDSANALDLDAARLGHYPDARNKKGVEPEGLEVATFGDQQYIFVVEERSSLVAIYKDTGAEPEYVQTIPSGISPEGITAIPARNLIVTANEVDLREDGGIGSHVMVYELAEGEAAYPQLVSDNDENGLPFGWAAISGAVGDAEKPGILYAVSDSALSAEPAIYTIDAMSRPARIIAKTVVTRGGHPAQKLDLEGITLDGEGGFWLASEGDTSELTPHALFHVNAEGEIEAEIPFPAELLANEIRSGSEGITAIGEGDDMTLWVAIQREWKDDPKGQVKLVSYQPSTEEWGAVAYPLETPAEGAWIGLSEITAHGDYVYIVERDNQIGDKAQLKALYRVPVADLNAAALGGELPVVSKELVRDFIPDLKSLNGYVVDKVESFAVDAAGVGYVITDNDGVDDSSGETYFWSIGAL